MSIFHYCPYGGAYNLQMARVAHLPAKLEIANAVSWKVRGFRFVKKRISVMGSAHLPCASVGDFCFSWQVRLGSSFRSSARAAGVKLPLFSPGSCGQASALQPGQLGSGFRSSARAARTCQRKWKSPTLPHGRCAESIFEMSFITNRNQHTFHATALAISD